MFIFNNGESFLLTKMNESVSKGILRFRPGKRQRASNRHQNVKPPHLRSDQRIRELNIINYCFKEKSYHVSR